VAGVFFSGGALAGSGPEPISSVSLCDTDLVSLEALAVLLKNSKNTPLDENTKWNFAIRQDIITNNTASAHHA